MKAQNWGFDTKTIDRSVRPQDDFYRYSAGNWLKKTKIPADEARWGSFTMLRVEVEKELRGIVESLQHSRAAAGSAAQMVRDFYQSGLDKKSREKLGTKPVEPWLKKVEHVKTKEELLKLVATFHRIGIDVLWGGMIDQDSKNSEKYALHFYQDGLGMPEREYYLKDDAESKRVRDAYVKHMHRMHRLFGMYEKESKQAVETVMRIETALAKASMTKEDARDAEKTYHKLSLPALHKLAPEIEWKEYLKLIGAGKISYVIAMQPEFLKAVGKMLASVSIEDWKIYLRWHLIDDAAGALSDKFLRASFDFYGKVLAGQKKMKASWRRALGATNGSLGEILGQLYVKKYFTPESKKKMNALVNDLFTAYEKRIKALDWMTPGTKKKAVAKLHQMNRKIGYPDTWKSYKGLVVKADDYFGNLMRSAEYEHKRRIKKLGRPIDRTEWLMYPQTVNAYCSFNMNEIVFPAAILQPPYFNPAADAAVNYGAIGAVIGHEITHGFDDQGSKFDAKGNMKGWWTREDKKHFAKKTNLVKKQYDEYTVAGGVHVNGQLTLGENIADLGGASIAYDAYQIHRAHNVGFTKPHISEFTPEQRFFLGFSLFDRELATPEFEKMHALTDPHSPGEFRVNGPLSNLPEFYAAFGVKKGDKLYRDPSKRAKIW